MSSTPLNAPRKPPRLAWGMYKKAVLGAILLVLSTSGAVATAALLQVKQASDIFTKFSQPLTGIDKPGILDGVKAGQPQTLMLLGSDRRFVDGKVPGNSDTIVLVRLDPDKGATTIMSIPRDLLVDIPGYGRAKINSAYADGGPQLTVRTVKQLFASAGVTNFPISHVVNVNFGGFQRAVNRVGCVYTDVDRKYFNDNAPPVDSPTDYAVINVKAGYQKLCGKAALEYVRFRHLDNDIVRGARQQDFLRQAKDQIGVSQLFGDREKLIEIFGRYTQTDIRGETAILRLLKLVVESAKNPLQEVRFNVADTQDAAEAALTTTPYQLAKAGREFMEATGSSGTRGKVKKTTSDRKRAAKQERRSSSAIPKGLYADRTPAEDLAAQLEVKTPFPVYYPKLADVGLKSYDTTASRTYSLRGSDNRVYRAYRIVAQTAGTGAYYGVQGTNWMDPPILDGAQKRKDASGRTFEVIGDGSNYRLVAWRTPNAVYWVSNTLQLSLSNSQMLGIARSLSRVGQ